jgi:hypothetical protein
MHNKRLQSDSASWQFLCIKTAQKLPACYAVEAGVIFARKLGGSLNQKELNDALIQAADCDLDSVIALLSDGADPNGMPLIMAIQCGAEDIVCLFIKNGVNLNVHYEGTTPLIRAVTSGYPNIVKLLMLNGAQPDFCDLAGKTALEWVTECAMPRLTAENKKRITGYISAKKQI